jgi:RNA polymerase sigma-70 factor (ECF subfamily)
MEGIDADARLAARIGAGDDPRAEEELCRRWLPRVRACARLHVRDAEAGSDLAQEVLVRLLSALREGRVRDGVALPAFVAGVCRNVAREWRAGEHRRGALLARFGVAWEASAPAAPCADRAKLASCLEKLSLRDRAVVVLTFVAEQDGDAIARSLAMTPGNVRVTRHRALKQLLGCLEGEGPS